MAIDWNIQLGFLIGWLQLASQSEVMKELKRILIWPFRISLNFTEMWSYFAIFIS